ncbi:hypothetical protein EDC01DRAFT_634377 [Geopyxis carbonaria]|nr:hypothetical protein EDC01DRAFT_634377 [Geopyxis carbonaria]
MTFCHLCSLMFVTHHELMQHIRATAGHSFDECQCDGCHPRVALYGNNRSRLFRTDRPRPKDVLCEACSTYLLVCTVGRSAHVESRGHITHAIRAGLFCETKGTSFLTAAERDTHFEVQHAPTETPIECVSCDVKFTNECALDVHFRLEPWHRMPSPQFCCVPCNFLCATDAELQAHLASRHHRPFRCIASALCGTRYRSLSGMMAHVESGSCVAGWDHCRFARFLLEHDEENVILKPEITMGDLGIAALETGAEAAEAAVPGAVEVTGQESDTDSDAGGTPILTPASSRRPSITSAPGICTPLSSALEPDVEELPNLRCPTCHRRFGSAQGLQDHVQSPAHMPKLYYCPTFLFPPSKGPPRGQRSFKTLAGLVAHLESGARGANALEAAMTVLEAKLAGMGLGETVPLGMYRGLLGGAAP